MIKISVADRIHGIDVGRGVVIGYTEDEGWWAYVEDPNLRRRILSGKTRYITKAKTVRITRGGRTIETQRRVRIPLKAIKLVSSLAEIIKRNDVVILERTGANGLRYARMLRRHGARVYIVDGKQFARFQSAFGGKDDISDARGLALYGRAYAISTSREEIPSFMRDIFKDMSSLRLYEIIDVEVKLRYLINAYRRADKDLTKAVNRLKDYLTAFLPGSHMFRTRSYLLNHLDDIASLIEDEDYRSMVEYEIQKIKAAKEQKERNARRLRELLETYYKDEYELLKSIPHITTIQIAVLMAYGGIRLLQGKIRSRDEFIGYALEGTRRTQSGKTDYKIRDKLRREVLHTFWMLYLQAHQKSSPLFPLVEYLKVATYGGDIGRKRYRKFVDKLLEIVRLMLKYGKTFEGAVSFRERQLSEQLERLNDKFGGLVDLMSQRRLKWLYSMAAALKAYRSILRKTTEDKISKIIDEILTEGKGG